ncbi:MAG: EndoU domain-containing protein [Defluviicoccus sp.]|nr:MAG: EndoU domain-containing protein [Defluviicoccus sp.]
MDGGAPYRATPGGRGRDLFHHRRVPGRPAQVLDVFPDRCTAEQIVQSIEYAASNPKRSHKQWGKIGLSGPELDSIRDHNRADHETFCLDNENKPFEIRLGVLADGRINTAFPN